jgi:hypothetical protein
MRLSLDAAERARLGRFARVHAIRNFGRSRLGRELLSVYRLDSLA